MDRLVLKFNQLGVGLAKRTSITTNSDLKESDLVDGEWELIDQNDEDDFVFMPDNMSIQVKQVSTEKCENELVVPALWENYMQLKNQQYKQDQMHVWEKVTLPSNIRKQLKFLIRKGIPNPLRPSVWRAVIFCETGNYHVNYSEKLSQIFGSKIPTSIVKYPNFGVDELPYGCLSEKGRQVFHRILCVLGSEHPSVKHAPVVTFLVSVFLHFMSEEDTFEMTNKLMSLKVRAENDLSTSEGTSDINYGSGEYFPTSLKGYHSQVYTFGGLVQRHLPRLWKHMTENLKMDHFEEFLPWFTTLFFGALPYPISLRILDSYLNEGTSVLYRVGLALLGSYATILLTCTDSNSFMNLLTQLLIQVDENLLMKLAFSYQFSQRHYKKLKEKTAQKTALVLEPQKVVYYRPKIVEPPRLFSEELFELLYEFLPERLRIQDPLKVYDNEQKGYSMTTFLNKMNTIPNSLIVFKTLTGNVFGAFIDACWENVGRGFVGSRDSFVFTIVPSFRVYGATRDYDIYANILHVTNDSFQIGVGRYGTTLHVNSDWSADSQTSETFNNPPLNSKDLSVINPTTATTTTTTTTTTINTGTSEIPVPNSTSCSIQDSEDQSMENYQTELFEIIAIEVFTFV